MRAVGFIASWLAASLLLTAGRIGASADAFRTPSVSALRVEWRAVLDQLRSEFNSRPAIAADFAFSGRRRVPASDPRATPALVQLNAATSPIFPEIGRSPIPVLLPFDAASYLEARQSGAPDSLSVSRYQADFRPVDLFHAGPAGYDAVFSLQPGAGDGMPQRTFARPVEVQISGSILTYDFSDPRSGKGEPVKALAAQFPDLRRFIREGYVRYAFTRFGIPYVVSIQCLDSTPRARRLACREAYPVAERFLKALRIAGGQPSRPLWDISSDIAERPAAPTSQPTRKSGFRSKKPRPSPIRNRRGNADRAGRPPAIRGATIFAKRAASRSDNAPADSAIRARISAPARARPTATTEKAATPKRRRSSPFATAC
jgi:hypothetical protein